MDGFNYFKVEPVSFKDHDAVLQTLDRESNGVYMMKEHFEGTEKAWEQVPVIFAKDHPDGEQVSEDLEGALKAVNGRLVGDLKNVVVNTSGQPKLMGTIDVKDDELEKKVPKGNIGISTAYFSKMKDGEDGKQIVDGTVIPNHLLIFEMDDETQPGDKGAFILNQQKKPKSVLGKVKNLILKAFKDAEEEEKKNQDPETAVQPTVPGEEKKNPNGADTTEEARRQLPPQDQPPKAVQNEDEEEEDPEKKKEKDEAVNEEEDPEKKKEEEKTNEEGEEDSEEEDEATASMSRAQLLMQLATSTQDLAMANERIAMLSVENERLFTQANQFVQNQKKFEEDKEEKEWQSFKAKLPPGMVKGQKEVSVRNLWKEDPAAVAVQALEAKDKQQVTNQEGAGESADKPGSSSGATIGGYDYETHGYKD